MAENIPSTSPSYEDLRNQAIQFLLKQKDQGKYIVGAYCCFAPNELIDAVGAIPVGLCAVSNTPIKTAETVLPSNLCPMIKANYGFIMEGSCPFFEFSDMIIGETTCDGKKKMFELIKNKKPVHILDLPSKTDYTEGLNFWKSEIENLKLFIEDHTHQKITNDKLEVAIRKRNRRRRLIRRLYEFGKISPPVTSGREMNSTLFILAGGDEYDQHLEKLIIAMESRVKNSQYACSSTTPRVLVTGCPLGGDSAKVLHIIEESGGIIVVHESCSGIKPVQQLVDEGTRDPIAAIARKYFALGCSCMTPNIQRLHLMEDLIKEYKPDCVIDVILQACHTYNIESYSIEQLCKEKYNLPFLKIETDYSANDNEQIKTRIETLLQMVEPQHT